MVSPIYANNKTMAILMKLFATRIVASSFFGLLRRSEIICIFTDLFSMPSSILDFVNENIATSAPEIIAEQASKITSKIILVRNDVLIARKIEIKTEGSGSKLVLFKLFRMVNHHPHQAQHSSVLSVEFVYWLLVHLAVVSVVHFYLLKM